jgi:copper chaperone CopZ
MSTNIAVEGMSCEHCEQTVENALLGVNGATSASVDREAERAVIEGEVEAGELVQAVEAAGYTARV